MPPLPLLRHDDFLQASFYAGAAGLQRCRRCCHSGFFQLYATLDFSLSMPRRCHAALLLPLRHAVISTPMPLSR